ncbi:phage shock protein PspA [Vibrio sp. UCD-FRSSP16_10]|uniref:phage shock protein PspA n=1 Tax=unclassified Vibrio TaxID=2614977 RepID=UPI0007FFC9FF|nr:MULTISPECIES: phage shock protein PspA [unclassified Vibrio]OBT13892.1 phage shock protein PspA [Vibrio sp. UCD-FRSSP16_30]OBT22773.1 phage shock protein PspA [Vibrio sp. UCD-FRSSP16_10]
MGIFSRFADIVNSNINSLLDKAEDPEKMIRLIIQEMEETLVEVRTNSAKALAERKDMQRRVQQLEEQVQDWQQKASLALSRGREELARAALVEKLRITQLLKSLQTEQTLIDETISKLSDEVGKLENKITETRARQSALAMRQSTAKNRKDIQQHLHSSRTKDTLAKFEQYQQKIDRLEADADSFDIGKEASLDDQFANLQADDEIEQELQKMKNSVNKPL